MGESHFSPDHPDTGSVCIEGAGEGGADVISLADFKARRERTPVDKPHLRVFWWLAGCCFTRDTLSRAQVATFLLEALPPPSISHYPQHPEKFPDL